MTERTRFDWQGRSREDFYGEIDCITGGVYRDKSPLPGSYRLSNGKDGSDRRAFHVDVSFYEPDVPAVYVRRSTADGVVYSREHKPKDFVELIHVVIVNLSACCAWLGYNIKGVSEETCYV